MCFKNYIIKYKLYFIIGVCLLLVFAFVALRKDNSPHTPIVVDALEKDDNDVNEPNQLETYSVDIKGAVKNPGVYKVVKGTNVNEVIELAGGLKSNGVTNNINLSKKVTDEMVIYVYTKSELNKISSNSENKVVTKDYECVSNTQTADITACTSSQNNSIITTTESNIKDDNMIEKNILININTANKDELLTLSGIGESKAECIISYRQENGFFNNIEEIKNVSGIGEALFEKIKNQITV